MCGIYGIVSLRGLPLADLDSLAAMGTLLRHRGPDAHGILRCPHAAFGAERLRIIDPSPAADQPFADPAQQIWLVLNGTIYNSHEIRRRYPEYPFRSRSDVEALMPLYLDLGVSCLDQIDGMFALAIYDRRVGTLLLARDRAGEKPLFYSHFGGEIWFASEIQALLKPKRCRPSLDLCALREFATFGYVREPRSMFVGLHKVESGTGIVFDAEGVRRHRYWKPDTLDVQPIHAADAVRELDQLLRDAVSRQLVADVPLGVFVSGGVDSSLLAALATDALGADRIHTFSVGFCNQSFDEGLHARRIASLLGTRHIQIEATEDTLRSALHRITTRLAEPIADPAILPTLLLAEVAREHVAVVLSGEGADELFGGYPTYLGHLLAPRYRALPSFLRAPIDQLAARLPLTPNRNISIAHLFKRFTAGASLALPERHIRWFGSRIDADDILGEQFDKTRWETEFPSTGDALRRAMLFDYLTYLRDDLLPKVDRATMLCSVEARSPYLDQAVTRFAFGLPTALKVRGITTKWVLKRVASRWLPTSIVRRRKRGLSVPISRWINCGLRGEIDRLLARERIDREGLLNSDTVQRLLVQHRRGTADHGRALWTIIVLEYWMQHWFSEE
ncbi:MAG: asparagine synthase (glutamine-hydrolyzing) [Gemmatimonadales bacterium]